MRSFFLEPARWREPYIIDGPEATHMLKVLRLKAGERIRLLDGQGRSGKFEISAVKASQAICTPLDITTHPRPQGRCWLAAAYTKAARRSFMLEKAVELEAGGIWFWQAEFSQAKLPPGAEGKEKWRAELVAGAKQSGNPWLPELKTLPGGAAELIEAAKNFPRRFLLWEDADAGEMLTAEDLESCADTIFIMGPEGGLSAREVKAFTQAGFKPVSLGRRVLRWETAAVLCLGLGWWMNELNYSRSDK